jgi:hypothetical protein
MIVKMLTQSTFAGSATKILEIRCWHSGDI